MRNATAIAMLLVLSACDHEEPAGGYLVYPVPSRKGAERVEVSVPPAPTDAHEADAAHIQILPDKRSRRPTEVLGVVDAHVAQGDEAAAIAVLRAKAATLGADAVLGVDLQHGEAHAGEPIHLSGLAVRYLERPVGAGE